MRQIKLLSLTLRDFKGVRSFSVDLQGGNAKVLGDNATGKTTLFDAFIWLLFDKDSQNKKDFSIKTLKDGKPLSGLSHEVEASFSTDGRELTLRKVFSEKWTKKRGSATSEFTGHTTDYYIDGVPAKKKEYTDCVTNVVDEDIFKLLTSPSYFNEQMKWQDRRKTLLEVCGDLTDEEVINSKKELAVLPAFLQGRSIEKHRKMIAAQRSEINKELEKIPVRIDEIERSLPQLDDLNKPSLIKEINNINLEIDEKMTQISNIRNGKAVSDKQKAIQEIELELMNIKRDHESDSKDKIYQLKARIQEEESNVSILNSKLENVKNSKRHNDENIKRIDEQLEKLRQEWHEVNSEEFVHTDACECPACGQALPEEQVTAAKEKALSQFNLSKAKRLEEINLNGKRNKERIAEIVQNNEQLANEFEKLNDEIVKKQALVKKLQTQLAEQESLVTDILDTPMYVSKLEEKQVIEDEIKQIQGMSESAIQDIQSEITTLKSKRDQLQTDATKFALADQSQKRIEELTEQERKLANEFEQLEQQLFLTEEFIRTKVNLLEDKINSKFKYARFKLFEQQINGGLVEVCETLYDGVPYSSGLNNAAKINVGLDIINTLSEHYGFKAPIFVDNAEAVTELINVDSQVISLVVSEKDKQLRIELEEAQMEEAI
ncbi:AAA family ATPase [Metabacillus fastidiosus]|uniref:AAA family ATPase n=1 Tax=Metabacillus fastidiosus TaxID=1458 RepID=UPI003D2C1812